MSNDSLYLICPVIAISLFTHTHSQHRWLKQETKKKFLWKYSDDMLGQKSNTGANTIR